LSNGTGALIGAHVWKYNDANI